MLTISLLKSKKWVGLILGLIVFLLCFILLQLKSFEGWQLLLSNLLQHPHTGKSSDIVVIAIDNDTLTAPDGLGDFSTWSRANYAKVLENIAPYKPKLVAFDIYLRDQRDTQGDALFSKVLESINNPILVFRYSQILSVLNKAGYFSLTPNPEEKLPLNLFSDISTITLSVSNTLADGDSLIRRVIPGIFDKTRKIYDESFSFAIARKVLNGKKLEALPPISADEYILDSGDGQTRHVPLENGQMLIRYYGGIRQDMDKDYFSVFPFKYVYHGDFSTFNPQNFKDKIVLIGATAKTIQDNFMTPLDATTPMPGVLIHANAIQTILDQSFLRNETPFEKIFFLGLLTLAASYIFLYSRLRWSMGFLAGSSVLYAAVTPFAFEHGLIMDLIHPYLALILTFIVAYIYRYVTEFREKTALRAAFSRYVNPTLVEQITEHPEQLRLGGENREITVIFTDIAHFTTISEQLKPESLVALLNEYFEAMAEVIMAEGGSVDKFEGDAIMAFFGAPILEQDHAVRACRAALLMRQKLQVLSTKWAQDPPLPGGEAKPLIDFRCGISSGPAVLGNVGSPQHQEYTVMGDTVNLGSRLESANKKYQTHTMVSEATYEAAKDFFEARELDIIKVVGKTHPIKVYELLNFKGQLNPVASRLLGLYNEGMQLYHERRFAEALAKFTDLLKEYPQDGPSKLYRQRCEVLKDYPPAPNWDGVFAMGEK